MEGWNATTIMDITTYSEALQMYDLSMKEKFKEYKKHSPKIIALSNQETPYYVALSEVRPIMRFFCEFDTIFLSTMNMLQEVREKVELNENKKVIDFVGKFIKDIKEDNLVSSWDLIKVALTEKIKPEELSQKFKLPMDLVNALYKGLGIKVTTDYGMTDDYRKLLKNKFYREVKNTLEKNYAWDLNQVSRFTSTGIISLYKNYSTQKVLMMGWIDFFRLNKKLPSEFKDVQDEDKGERKVPVEDDGSSGAIMEKEQTSEHVVIP